MESLSWLQIFGKMLEAFLPVWISMAVVFGLSIFFKARLSLYGRLFDSTVGMIGFAIILFWVFTAIWASSIAPFDALEQISGLKNKKPGVPVPNMDGMYYLLGGDNLARDVFSRMVYGSQTVLRIAPAATLFAFLVGVTLGLPAGYFSGRLDTTLSFLANLVLAFPVILLFYLLVTPEIRQTGVITWVSAVLFIFPIIFFVVLIYSRFFTRSGILFFFGAPVALVMFLIYLGTVFEWDPFIWSWTGFMSYVNQGNPIAEWVETTRANYRPWFALPLDANALNIFVSVVFVNSPTVFRIVRGLTMDIKTRDYVAAAQTRGEGAWYIMLWEILPNARGPLIVDFCLRIGYTTILLGTLGFFGLGVSPESPDWGMTINEGRKLLTIYPHPALPPAIALMSLVLGLNLLADGLREESLKD
ncbi:MAG: ABC transporter permease [Paracoccaceae bacterium]